MVNLSVANGLRKGDIIVYEKGIFSIVSNDFNKPGKGRPFNRIKMKGITSQGTREITVSPDETFHFADITECPCSFMYSDDSFYYFMNSSTYETETIAIDALGEKIGFITEGLECEILKDGEIVIDLKLPTFVMLKVIESENAVRGDTAGSRVMKDVILETGIKVKVPIFINTDEMIKIDTRTKEYQSRS